MMKCRKNKHKNIIQEYRSIIGEQARIIKEQNVEIDKLKSYRSDQDHKFMEYFQFYTCDRKKYTKLLKEAGI